MIRLKKLIHLFNFIFCISFFSANVYADKITWLATDFPPMSMSEGEFAKQGYIDTLYKHLKTSLPHHEFSELVVPWARGMSMAEKGGNYCLIAAFQTVERDRFLRFTEPYGYSYPLGLIVRTKDKNDFSKFLNKDGHIDLNSIIEKSKLIIGITNERSYGAKIDNAIKPLLNSESKRIVPLSVTKSTKNLFEMLKANRIDLMFAYPSELVFFENTKKNLSFFSIEGNSDLLPGKFSCTRSSETDRVFKEVSDLTLRPEMMEVFRKSYERWLPSYVVKDYHKRLEKIKKAK